MTIWQQHFSRLGVIGLLTLTTAVMTGLVAAQEIAPIAIEEAVLVPDEGNVPSDAPEAVSASPGSIVHPLLPAIPPAVKARARRIPADPRVDVMLTPSEPEALTADVVTSFVGLDRPSAADQGSVFFPPDTIVAKSNNRVLEGVNNALRLFTNTGGVLATTALTPFFSASTANGFFTDPKVYFDRNAANRRFYVVALQIRKPPSSTPFVSLIHLAVSRTPDPDCLTSSCWCRYSIDGRREIGTANASWADYPGLGVGADKLVITTNQFRFTDDAFRFATIRVLNKNILANNPPGSPCPALPAVSVFQPAAAAGDFSIFTLQPVQHYTSPSSCTGASNPVYLINSVRNTISAQTNYRVWRVANLAPVILQGPMTLAGAFGYTIPPNAPQGGSAVLLDTGDARVTQAAGTANLIEGVHGTGCNIGGGANESCVRYVRFAVGCSPNGGISAAFNQQFTFGGNPGGGDFLFWPGTARNIVGQSGFSFQRSNSVSRLSAWWAVKPANGTPNLASPFATGTCAQTISDRTGDYSGAHTDPSNFTDFCFAGERVTTISGTCQWQTQITCVRPGSDVIVLNAEQ